MSRKIQAPGIEVNEIDFSQYADTTDNSIVGTTAFLMGFADKGMDYATKYVNSMATYKKMFGSPLNEAETYLYNAANEVISRGGNAYVTKLPYDNDVLNKYSYTDYTVEDEMIILSSPYDVVTNNFGLLSIHYYDFILEPDINVDVLVNLITEFSEKYIIDELSNKNFVAQIENEKINLLEDFFDEFNINLSVIGDFVNYVLDECNFNDDLKSVLDGIFKNSDGTIKNCSTYLLSCLYDDYTQLSNVRNSNIKNEFIVENEYFIRQIKDKLLLTGNFKENKEQFGRYPKLGYYKKYLENLIVSVENIEDNQILKRFIMYILNGYNNELMNTEYTEIKHVDDSLTSSIEIKSNDISKSGLMSMDDLDSLRTNQLKLVPGSIRIVDITRSKYSSEYNIINKKFPKEYLGLLPVITTPMNAMYYQNIIKNSDDDFRDYIALSAIKNINSNNKFYDEIYDTSAEICCMMENLNNDSIDNVGFSYNLGPEKDNDFQQVSTSKTAASFFPELLFIGDRFDRKHIKDIGVVVFSMEVDKSSDYKIILTPIESYVGSLNRKAIDPETKANKFIDDVINNSSSRINFFSNIRFSLNAEVPLTINDKASTFIIHNQEATSLGFYTKDCLKHISVGESINKAIDKIFDNNADMNKVEIDLVVDAGVSNIAQFIKQVYPNKEKGYFDLGDDNAFLFKLKDQKDTRAWYSVISKYDTFCKNTRKDCMFIADGLRSLCLTGDEKVVRNTKPDNTIQNTILKNIKYMSGLINSSYGAGYSDWFLSLNAYNNVVFWCPPSIKVAGIYINTDVYSHYWSAPAGLNRGKLQGEVFDVAFSPTLEQAGVIYNNNWNYAVNYPIDGIVMEGQRTFQRNKTAFDRVNVRRLFLGLEKEVRYIAKYFKYDGITDYMMMRFTDLLTNLFEDVRNKGGINEYYIICDRRNNTPQTIENNELHCTIAIRPQKVAEFIVINFICGNQSVDVQELAEGQL